jgi:hypothetical protein
MQFFLIGTILALREEAKITLFLRTYIVPASQIICWITFLTLTVQCMMPLSIRFLRKSYDCSFFFIGASQDGRPHYRKEKFS